MHRKMLAIDADFIKTNVRDYANLHNNSLVLRLHLQLLASNEIDF